MGRLCGVEGGGGGDYVCHHDRVGHIETEVVTHVIFLPFSLIKFITTSDKSKIIMSLLTSLL